MVDASVAMPFPRLVPPAVDDPHLIAPVKISEHDVPARAVFPMGGGQTKFLLTEETAGCRHIALGVFLAAPGEGSWWHTHPAEAEEEEYLYVLAGEGTLLYWQRGTIREMRFREGEAVFTGHLTHRIQNTGAAPLKLCFAIAPLPRKTVFHHEGPPVDSQTLAPPQLVRPEQVELTPFTKGGILNRKLLTTETVGARHGRLGLALEAPGKGSFWHTHPHALGEEDLFYTIHGVGIMVYLHGGNVHTFTFRAGDAIHSHHLTNYTTNPGPEDLVMVYVGAPNPQATIVHDLAE